jgi:predicted transposase/invertase (TIGR01784 family)
MFDNLSKFLAQEYSRDFATWLIGRPVKLTELKPTELSLEPIRADSVILLKSRGLISHTEFQTDPDPEIPFREADYALRIHRKFPRHDLLQNVIYLRKTNSPLVFIDFFEAKRLRHEFNVIRLWEQPTEKFLKYPGLWPYASLTNTSDPIGILEEVAHKIDQMDDLRQQSNLSAISAVMAALSLDKDQVESVLRRNFMKESAIYQKWRQENLAEGRVEGRAEGQGEGREAERRSIALKMLAEGMSLEVIAKITGYSVKQLQSLQS